MDEEDRWLASNVVGELVVRGANVMRGYCGLPEETARIPGRAHIAVSRFVYAVSG